MRGGNRGGRGFKKAPVRPVQAAFRRSALRPGSQRVRSERPLPRRGIRKLSGGQGKPKKLTITQGPRKLKVRNIDEK